MPQDGSDPSLAPSAIARHADQDLGATLARDRLELGVLCKSLATRLVHASMTAGDAGAWKPIADELAAAIDKLAEMPPQPVVAWMVLSDTGEITQIAHNVVQRDAAMVQGKRLVPLAFAAPCLTPFARLQVSETPLARL